MFVFWVSQTKATRGSRSHVLLVMLVTCLVPRVVALFLFRCRHCLFDSVICVVVCVAHVRTRIDLVMLVYLEIALQVPNSFYVLEKVERVILEALEI